MSFLDVEDRPMAAAFVILMMTILGCCAMCSVAFHDGPVVVINKCEDPIR